MDIPPRGRAILCIKSLTAVSLRASRARLPYIDFCFAEFVFSVPFLAVSSSRIPPNRSRPAHLPGLERSPLARFLGEGFSDAIDSVHRCLLIISSCGRPCSIVLFDYPLYAPARPLLCIHFHEETSFLIPPTTPFFSWLPLMGLLFREYS